MNSGKRMLNYYPYAVKTLAEFQALMDTEGVEVDSLQDDTEICLTESYLHTMGESRIIEWEKALQIQHGADDTLQDRRDVIIARIRGQGKLNTALINAIVGSFTGGEAISYIEDSTLYVKIIPPPDNKQYKFENVQRELLKKIPAHLGLVVTRNYATWNNIKNDYASWNDVAQFENWDEINNLIMRQ